MNGQHRAMQAIREAGQVELFANIPHHGRYTAGEHAYNCLSMMVILHPSPSAKLVHAALWRRIPERWMGTITEHVKDSAGGDFVKRLDLAANDCLRSLGVTIELTAIEWSWIDAVDRTAVLLWAKDQVAMGNQNAQVTIGALNRWFEKTPIPREVAEYINAHRWTRLPDEMPRSQ